MTVYWQSTKAPVHLFRREYESAETAEHLKENCFIDAAVLADELRISEMAVQAYQRRLRLRRITTRKDYK